MSYSISTTLSNLRCFKLATLSFLLPLLPSKSENKRLPMLRTSYTQKPKIVTTYYTLKNTKGDINWENNANQATSNQGSTRCISINRKAQDMNLNRVYHRRKEFPYLDIRGPVSVARIFNTWCCCLICSGSLTSATIA